MTYDYDFIVIGSGFGGSVAALRLAEKGYTVGVLEMGKEYKAASFPKTNWNLRKFFWLPALGLQGFFQMSLFKHAWVLTGTGVGGGSLVYSNTLWVPNDEIWLHPSWSTLKDWVRIMPKYFDQAQKMLGAVKNPYMGPADDILFETSKDFNIDDTFYRTNVGVYIGEEGVTVPDPYFDGKGPTRTGCNYCGACMVGCKNNAKNTLDKNYLHLAKGLGAHIIPEAKVIKIETINGIPDGSDGYTITAKNPLNPFAKKRKLTSKGVILSAGVLGTVQLLLESKALETLPNISDKVGELVRTNSESLIGVRLKDKSIDIGDGICIGSGAFLDEVTHVEAVRYPNGSDSISLLTTLLADAKSGVPRFLMWAWEAIKNPLGFLQSIIPFGFARSTIILLVMQRIDNHINLKLTKSLINPFRKKLNTYGPKIPTFIPKANELAKSMAARFKGTPLTSIPEIFLDVPTTAHILGGAIMGKDKNHGVIDLNNKVFNYENLYVCDGSMIGANLGVNPSLTITALAEHAMDNIPPRPENF